jgi:hypothetical protein
MLQVEGDTKFNSLTIHQAPTRSIRNFDPQDLWDATSKFETPKAETAPRLGFPKSTGDRKHINITKIYKNKIRINKK